MKNTSSAKKVWDTPTLVVHGTVDQLTKADQSTVTGNVFGIVGNMISL